MAGYYAARYDMELLDEKERLVRSITGLYPADGDRHAATIRAVKELLQWYSEEIPWRRMYESFPDWQQQSGLLDEHWDRDGAPERASVLFTLLTPRGDGAFRRKALGGDDGTWESKSGRDIGDGVVVLSKLYYASRRLTAIEFHLAMDDPHLQQAPRVAMCVLHPKGHRHCVRDLKDYCYEGYFPRGNQPNLQIVQPFTPIYPDSNEARPRNGPHVDGATLLAFNSESSNHSLREASPASASLDGFTQFLLSDNSTPELHLGTEDIEQTNYIQPWTVSSQEVSPLLASQIFELHSGTQEFEQTNNIQLLTVPTWEVSPLLASQNGDNSMFGGSFPGGDQAYPQRGQPLAPIDPAHSVGGFMNGTQDDYTINPDSELHSGIQEFEQTNNIQPLTVSTWEVPPALASPNKDELFEICRSQPLTSSYQVRPQNTFQLSENNLIFEWNEDELERSALFDRLFPSNCNDHTQYGN